MQQKIDGSLIFVKATSEEGKLIKKWHLMRYDRKNKWWYGEVSRTLLMNLKKAGGLSPPAEEILNHMNIVQTAIDKERIKPDKDIKPLYKFPVKRNLYTHQIRAANMCALLFGIVEPGR